MASPPLRIRCPMPPPRVSPPTPVWFDDAAGRGQPEYLAGAIEVRIEAAALDPDGADRRIDPGARHRRQVDHQAAIGDGVPGDGVAAASDRGQQVVFAAEPDGGHHVGGIAAAGDQGGPALDMRVPGAVVEIPSATRPRLTRSLASQLAAIGRLDFLGTLTSQGPPPRRTNSAQRLADLWRRLSLSEEAATAVSRTSGPILLVDDLVDTGWTMTLAARLLRQAGASSVLPFALASTT